MTCSDCWIGTVADEDFQTVIQNQRKPETERADRLNLLPSSPGSSHYWLPIQYIDNSWIRVSVSRVRLMEFLEETFEPEPEPHASMLQAYVRDHFRIDRTYIIEAKEF